MNKHNKKLMGELKITKAQLTRLRQVEARIQEQNEAECNGEMTEQMIMIAEKFQLDAIAEIHNMLKDTVSVVSINNDPRGPAIRLKLNSGYYNCPDETLSIIGDE